MKIKSFLLLLTILFISSSLIINCAGTRGEEDEFAADSGDSQQEDLDDIEKLLGITTEESQPAARQQTTKSGDEDRLDLLEKDAVVSKDTKKQTSAYQAAALAGQEKNKQEQELKALKNKLRKKDNEISGLKEKLSYQDSEIERLAKKGGSYPSGGSGPIGDVSLSEYQNRYDEARAAFESRNYNRAISLFESLLASSANHSLSDNAQYWIGESHYALGQYNAAIIAFEKVFTFSKSNKKDDAQYKLGLCYLRKKENAKAQEEFSRLVTEYPKSEYVSRAQKKIASL